MKYEQVFGVDGFVPLNQYADMRGGICPHCGFKIEGARYLIGVIVLHYCVRCKKLYTPFAGKLVAIDQQIIGMQIEEKSRKHITSQLRDSIREQIIQQMATKRMSDEEGKKFIEECHDVIYEMVGGEQESITPIMKRLRIRSLNVYNAVVTRLMFIKETKNTPNFTDEQMRELKEAIQKVKTVEDFLESFNSVGG